MNYIDFPHCLGHPTCGSVQSCFHFVQVRHDLFQVHRFDSSEPLTEEFSFLGSALGSSKKRRLTTSSEAILTTKVWGTAAALVLSLKLTPKVIEYKQVQALRAIVGLVDASISAH